MAEAMKLARDAILRRMTASEDSLSPARTRNRWQNSSPITSHARVPKRKAKEIDTNVSWLRQPKFQQLQALDGHVSGARRVT